MKNSWKVKEIVILAFICAVVGVIYTVMDYLYNPLYALLGPVFMELTFGIYLLSTSLPMYIARKPGAAIFGGLVCAGVNLLLGSPYGIQVVLAGALEGAGIELGYLLGKRYSGNAGNRIFGAVLAALFVFVRDYIVFGYSTLSFGVVAGVLTVRILSAILIGGLLTRGITAGLKKANVLNGFRCVLQ